MFGDTAVRRGVASILYLEDNEAGLWIPWQQIDLADIRQGSKACLGRKAKARGRQPMYQGQDQVVWRKYDPRLSQFKSQSRAAEWTRIRLMLSSNIDVRPIVN